MHILSFISGQVNKQKPYFISSWQNRPQEKVTICLQVTLTSFQKVTAIKAGFYEIWLEEKKYFKETVTSNS